MSLSHPEHVQAWLQLRGTGKENSNGLTNGSSERGMTGGSNPEAKVFIELIIFKKKNQMLVFFLWASFPMGI